MKNVDDLIESATELADQGLSKGEIADELNVSRETASWLVERGGGDAAPSSDGTGDIHVDWSAFGRDATRLSYAGKALADLLARPASDTSRPANGTQRPANDTPGSGDGERVDLVVGIEKAGVPLATVVARELDADLATYAPSKHQWEQGDIADLGGTFSRNFAEIRGRDCLVVDDTITSGTTMTETVHAIREEGGSPRACGVLVDKQGVEALEEVPVRSLLQVLRVGDG